jgi:acetylglutamate kinase
MQSFNEKERQILEFLPYVEKYRSKTLVFKYGGSISANDNSSLKEDIIRDLTLLKYIGINIVIVHGGGSEITNYMNKLGMKAEFANGRRVTSSDAMEVVQMVLVGKINQKIVSTINKYGGKAVGLTGNDANLFVVKKRMQEKVFDEATKTEKEIDLGFVGDIQKVNEKLITYLCEKDYIPVISPIGIGIDDETYNVNADDAACSVAQALKAEKLIILTNVDGIYEVKDNPNTVKSVLTVEEANLMLANNKIAGGMIPKITACINAINNGIKSAHIINGKKDHSILLEIFTDKGIGTMIGP